MSIEYKKILTAEQAADFLQVSPRTIHKLIASGQLSGRKIGNKYRTTGEACLAYLSVPHETIRANAGDIKGNLSCQSPNETEYGTVISSHRQVKELDALLERRTKNKQRSYTIR
ncbi:helix-turn-helix domain-containing protein [Arsenophonus sp. PmNCSU2021_1]|uniref:helix-turn-helix domain-containing protein n=1 Tax=Arsenophonus sp. PmNCSU2021_1 TaxID=3118989 RepID=UPI002FF29D72